jgi:hypothetical protein
MSLFDERLSRLTGLPLARRFWTQAVQGKATLWISCEPLLERRRSNSISRLMEALAPSYPQSGSLSLSLFVGVQGYDTSDNGQTPLLTHSIRAHPEAGLTPRLVTRHHNEEKEKSGPCDKWKGDESNSSLNKGHIQVEYVFRGRWGGY